MFLPRTEDRVVAVLIDLLPPLANWRIGEHSRKTSGDLRGLQRLVGSEFSQR